MVWTVGMQLKGLEFLEYGHSGLTVGLEPHGIGAGVWL